MGFFSPIALINELMATCCWTPADFSTIPPTFWGEGTAAWVDLLSSGAEKFWAGVPSWLSHNEDVTAWRVVNSAHAQLFTAPLIRFSHRDSPENFQYARSDVRERKGSLIPIVVYDIPDIYFTYGQGIVPYYNKFGLSTALDYTKDINTDIPRQLKAADPFYLAWKTWKEANVGNFPNNQPSTTEDINIFLEWVHLPGVRIDGGAFELRLQGLTNKASLFQSTVEAQYDAVKRDLSGFVTPILYLKRTDIYSALLGYSYDVSVAAQTAAPAPNVSDANITDAMNRIYPNGNKVDFEFYIHGKRFEREDRWDSPKITQVLYDHFRDSLIPVQQWSAPDGFSESV